MKMNYAFYSHLLKLLYKAYQSIPDVFTVLSLVKTNNFTMMPDKMILYQKKQY